MDKYKKAGMFIEEYAISYPPEVLSTEAELTERYVNFKKEFAPEKLAIIPDHTITNDFMQIQERLSGLDKTFNERVMVDDKFRDVIVKGAKIISSSTLENVDDYDILNDKLAETIGPYFQSLFVYKYFSAVFPEIFSACYQPEIQTHIIYCCGIIPNEKLYVRGGQLAMLANHACMLSPIFNTIALAYFGNIKNYCKIDITNETFDVLPFFRERMFVAIGFKEIRDLNNYVQQGKINIDLLRDNLVKFYYPNNPQLAAEKANDIANFWNSNSDTAFVIMRDGFVIALADCQNKYCFYNDTNFAHVKSVTWRSFLGDNIRMPIGEEGANSICCYFQHKYNKLFLYQKYYNVFHPDAATSSVLQKRLHPYNQALFGASGTGKTFSTTEMAMAIVENREVDFKTVRIERDQAVYRNNYNKYVEKFQIVFITFHPGYTYKDFIQSIGHDNSLENGVFLRMADRANRNKDRNFVLIIDEINRAYIPSVFGEVISLLDTDKRDGEANEISASLPLGARFTVPNNLYLIVTINSVDKSLPPIDPALRRRFDFIEVLPDENLIQDPILKAVFVKLNDELYKLLNNSDLLIGHSYFMDREARDLVEIFNFNVLPLIYEYFENDNVKIKEIVELSAGNYVDIVDNRFGRVQVCFKPQATEQTYQQQATEQTYQQPQATEQSYQQPQATEQTYQQPQVTEQPYQQPQATEQTYQQQATEQTYQQPQATEQSYQQPQATEQPYQQPQATEQTYQQPQATEQPYQQPQATEQPYQQPQATEQPYQQPYKQPYQQGE